MKRSKKILVSIFTCFAAFSMFAACGKGDGPLFLKGILKEIEYGESILLDEYIDYVDDSEFTITVTGPNGYEQDLTSYAAWAAPAPGVYTITYTVAEGENEGSNSFDLTVVAPEIQAEYTLQDPKYVKGETIIFNDYFETLNLYVDSYYSYTTIMESVTVGETTKDVSTATTYTFTEAGTHTFKFRIQSEDGQIVRGSEDITVYGWDGDTYAWMKENNISGYKLEEVTAEKKVVIEAGTHDGKASDFPNGSYIHDLGYFAYNGEYGIGDYIVVDFTGDNMPAFSFFRDNVTTSYYWYKYHSTADVKGISVVNGFRMNNGTNAVKFAGGVNSSMRLYGPYGIEHQDQGTSGRMCLQGYVGNDEFGIEDLQQKYTNVPLRMICGFSAGSTTSVTFHTAVLRLDTMEVLKTSEVTIQAGEGGPLPENYFTGSFVLYGAHGKTITLDKVHAIEEDTTMEALLAKYYGTPSEFKAGAKTSVAQNEVLNVSDYIAPTAGADWKLSWTDGTDIYPITGETFSFANGGTVQLIYNDGINSTVRLDIQVVDAWLVQNNLTLSKGTITSSQQVVFEAGDTARGQAGKAADQNSWLGYLAYQGEYGVRDYVVVDFTGNNMPMIQFFGQKLNDNLVNVDEKTLEEQGVIFTNGYLDSTGADGWIMDGMYVLGNYGVRNIGFADKANQVQYRKVCFNDDFGALDLANSTTKYRMIVGFEDITDTSLTINWAIINLDTNEVAVQRTFSISTNVTMATYDYTGNIQIFGHYGKTITLDKVYAIEEDTTLADLLTKYTPSAVEE